MALRFSIFPKFLQHLDAGAMIDAVLAAGLDTTNVVVRDGFWVSQSELATELPAFLEIARSRGVEVDFATAAGLQLAALAADDTPLAVLAEHGIRDVRVGYVPNGEAPRAAIETARTQLGTIERSCLKHGIRAIYQVHHGRCVASASAAAMLVDGLDPRAVGVMIDPGNQQHEGWERPHTQFGLLGAQVAAIGVKDVAVERGGERDGPGKGWRRNWVSCAEGVIDWRAVFAAARDAAFDGSLVLMPFYHAGEGETRAHLATLTGEVDYLRRELAVAWPGAVSAAPT